MASDDMLKVGWIGTGVMGSSMCGHLLAAGFPVNVFNRSKERARAGRPGRQMVLLAGRNGGRR